MFTAGKGVCKRCRAKAAQAGRERRRAELRAAEESERHAEQGRLAERVRAALALRRRKGLSPTTQI
jgi:hypothetical protein